MLTPSNQYLQAVEEINDYVNQAKCRASVSVNSEIMKTNIFIGNVIIRNSEWGNKFVENLSKDMKMRFPSAKGYSVRNLKYMKKFAQIFTEDDVDEYGLGRITWSHHQILMSKVSNREEYIWYLEKTLEHKWSVDDLTSQVKSQLYERQAVANKISNFERRLPAEQKNMVLSTMKDPYMFDFIDYTEEMLETDIENELVKNVYIPATERNKIEIKRLYDKCLKAGIYLDKNCLDNYNPEMFASVFFHNEITKHEENQKLLSEEAWNSSKIFYRQYMSDPKTPLYVEMDDFVPDFNTASNLVREAGGLVFIPHIYEYKKNSEPILEHILKNYKIDGIECYYTTFTEEQHEKLLKLCNERNLFISGGSDFHGTIKPDVDIGTGYGNLKIPNEIIIPWENKIKYFTPLHKSIEYSR